MPENDKNNDGELEWEDLFGEDKTEEKSQEIVETPEESGESPYLEVKPIGVEDLEEKQPPDETLIEPSSKKGESDTEIEKIAREIREKKEKEKRERALYDTGEIIWTRGDKEQGKAYAIGVRDGFLSRDKEERDRAISRVIGNRDLSDEIREKVTTMFDISNPKEAIVDEDGFLKLPGDENNRRFLVVYKRLSDKEAIPHIKGEKGITAYNVAVFFKAIDEIDLTTPYVDKKAFWDLVDEISIDRARELVKDRKEVERETFDELVAKIKEDAGTREAIQKVLNSPGMLGQNKAAIGRRLKTGYEGFRMGYNTKFEKKRFLWNQENLDINKDYLEDDDNEGIFKISINPISKAEDAEILMRARENAIDRIVHRYKVSRLCTFKTTGGRDAAPMHIYVTPDLGEFIERLDEIRRQLGELKEGETGGLESLIERGALPILEALGYMHGLGVKHRDQKPGNIFLGKDGYARVSDFSIGKTEEQRTDVTAGTVLGSPMYMSPAQAWGENTDERDDIYSFGATLRSEIVGKAPYGGNRDQVINCIRNGVKPFGIRNEIFKEKLYEDLGINKWYQKINPVNWWRWRKRNILSRRVDRILARCCQTGNEEENFGRDRIYNSCQEVHEDFESALNGKEPKHVNGYLKETGMSERQLIEGAYELRAVQMSEEAKRVKTKTQDFYRKLIPAVVLGSVLTWEGCKFGYKTIKDALRTIENGSVNK